MKPIPEKHEEGEILIICSFISARIITKKMNEKYPQYDFWSVDSKTKSGVYVGTGLDDKNFGILFGYADCLLDTLNYLRGKQ